MLDEWRKSVILLIYKNKRDIQTCLNNHGIKLISYTMKLWEKVMSIDWSVTQNIREPIWIYAWKADYRSYFASSEINGEI